ncbi:hypothetical protein H0H93_000851, partial [Arthromyces matolae]
MPRPEHSGIIGRFPDGVWGSGDGISKSIVVSSLFNMWMVFLGGSLSMILKIHRRPFMTWTTRTQSGKSVTSGTTLVLLFWLATLRLELFLLMTVEHSTASVSTRFNGGILRSECPARKAHILTIIEADGEAVTPMTVDQMDLLAGQGYSVVPINPSQTTGLTHHTSETPPLATPTYSALTHRAPESATLSRAILRSLLRQISIMAKPPEPTINITLNLVVTTGKAQWNVNNVSYLPPEVPTLLKILEGANKPTDFAVTENTFVLPKNAVIQVEFPHEAGASSSNMRTVNAEQA